jgi:hypothetical protein
MIEGAFFFTMIGIAIILLVVRFQYREFFQFVAATMFLVMGLAVMSGQDVAFYTFVDDGVSSINQTQYVIGDGTTIYGFAHITTGMFLVLLGTITTAVAILSWIAYDPKADSKR